MSWYDVLTPWRTRNEVITTSADLARLLAGGQDTIAGITIDEKTALTYSAVWAATRAISEDIAKLPLFLFQRDAADPRQKSQARDHPLFRVLHSQANDWQTAFKFRELMQRSVLMRGNAYAFPTRVRGEIVELIPIDPTRVTVKQDPDFRVHYLLTQEGGRPVLDLGPTEILHIMGPSLDGLTGLSVITQARQSMALGLAEERYGGQFFGDGPKPPLAITHPGHLSDTAHEHLKDSLNDTDRGRRNLLLEEGMVAKEISFQNDDAQFLESRTFQVDEIARWFRLPPHKLAQLQRATFSNIEEQSREYVTDSLMPWAVNWEQEIAKSLLPPDAGLFAEHVFEGLLRGRTKERFESYAIAITNGWMTRNEVRALENLNPGADELDEHLTPLNMREGQEEAANVA